MVLRHPAPAADRIRPWLLGGAMALCVCRPLFTAEGTVGDGDGLPVAILWIALSVVWMLHAIGLPSLRLRFSWAEAAVLLFIVMAAVSSLWAVHGDSPRPAVNALFEWLALGLGFFLFRQFIGGPREARAVVAVMVALAAALACYGLYQVSFELPATRAFYFANPDEALRELGIPNQAGPLRQLFESRLRNSEPLATFALTNSLAAFLAPWLVMVLGIGIVARSRAGLDRRLAIAVACTAIPLAACLLWTKSRSGYVAVVVGIVAIGLACRRTSRTAAQAGRGTGTACRGWQLPTAVAVAIVIAGMAVFVAGTTSGRGYTSAMFDRATASFGYRLQYWRSTLRMVGDHWLAGCGPGNFQNAYTRYKLPEASEEVADPHNFVLEIWATMGTPAMLAFLGILGAFAAAMRNGRPPAEMTGVALASTSQTASGNPQGLATTDAEVPPDRPFIVLGGAAVGLVLSIPFGLMSSAPPSPVMLLVAAPVMAGVLAAWWRWIERGRLPPVLPAIAVAALLVDLSAAGGIGLSSVAGSFWLLLAVGLWAVDAGRVRRMSRSFAVVGLIAALLLTLACYTFAYAPVLACQAAIRTAYRQPARAEKLLQDAVCDDPWAAKPRELLAALALDEWRREPDQQRQRQFERYNAMLLEVDSASSAAWLAAGDGYFEIAMKTQHARDRQKAIDCYRQAVERYPNSSQYRAKLALAWQAAGRTAEFRREADIALKLDHITPHESMKLPPETRKQLRQGAPQP